MDWLQRAFGFRPGLLVTDDRNRFVHTELHFGAGVVIEIKDEEYNGRGFSCTDPEGRLWSIGTFNPWTYQHDGMKK